MAEPTEIGGTMAEPTDNSIRRRPPRARNGVRLKSFEAIMYDVLTTPEARSALTPRYSVLPPPPPEAQLPMGRDAPNEKTPRPLMWPFDDETNLPPSGRVRGSRRDLGDLPDGDRAWRKEAQLSNMIRCVLALIPDGIRNGGGGSGSGSDDTRGIFRIVDFGGGTGHLAVPLALLLPQCEIVCVDLKDASLVRLRGRVDRRSAAAADGGIGGDDGGDAAEEANRTAKALAELNRAQSTDKLPGQSQATIRCATLPNMLTYHGSIESYSEPFDIGVSLHACGEASDLTLRIGLDRAKAGFVVCGCCCGKLRSSAKNPYVYHATGGNDKTVVYPQSNLFRDLGRRTGGGNGDDSAADILANGDGNGVDVLCSPCVAATVDHGVSNGSGNIASIAPPAMPSVTKLTPRMFDEIAKASDYNELGDVRKPRNACRRAAKSLVEWDRVLFARERMTKASSSLDDDKTQRIAANADANVHARSPCNVVLTRMVPWEASPKNDILVGWFHGESNPYRGILKSGDANDASNAVVQVPIPVDESCHLDFKTAMGHLFDPTTTADDDTRHGVDGKSKGNINAKDGNDWTADEETDIRVTLESFVASMHMNTNADANVDVDAKNEGVGKVLRFPAGMGRRRRKLVHLVAETMDLAHWGEGKKDSEKIVTVARRRKKRGAGAAALCEKSKQ